MDGSRGGTSMEDNDIALARAEHHSAALQAAERVVAMVAQHYANIRANALSPDSTPLSPTESEYFSSYESHPTTPVDQHPRQLQDKNQPPPKYPGTPQSHHQDGGFPSTPIRAHVMSSSDPQGTQPQTPTQPPLSQPRTTTYMPCVVPTTLTRVNHLFNVNSPGTPNPLQKHYSVVAGRRTGVYSSWNLAKPMIQGLGELSSCQGFATLEDAAHDYFTACAKGHVKIVRLPGDSVSVFGPVDAAEDLDFVA